MKTFFFVQKQNISDNSTRDIFEDYCKIFHNADVSDVELVSFDRKQLFISDTLKKLGGETVFLIPSVLDSFNAFSYDGVELALKIYFYYASQKNNKFRIVVLSFEEEAAFWEHCRYSNILKCPHVDFIQNNIYSIKDYLINKESIDWSIDWGKCIDSLRKLNISQPASHKTHHSITNEWCIYRWSKYLGIENIEIQKEIEDFLYFNYLKAIYPEKHIDSKKILLLEKGKVLLVDDEVGKGWSSFFKSFCNKYTGTEFDSIGETFKNLSAEEIIIAAEEKVKKYCPDVVVLDLRLHDDDFDNKEPLQLTGARVFERIKKINEGIQIVVFSASNKVWNYLPLASDGVILKESPELSVRENYTQECIKNMLETLRTSLERGSFFSKLYGDIESTKQNLPNNDFGNSISNQLNIAYYLISRAEKPEQYAFAYVSLYLVIEMINKEFLVQDANGDWCLKSNQGEKIKAWNCEKNVLWDFSYKKDQSGNRIKDGKGNDVVINIANGNAASEWQKIVGVLKQEKNSNIADSVFSDLQRRIQARNWFIHDDKKIRQLKADGIHYAYETQRELFKKDGFIALFNHIKAICSTLWP